MLIKDREYSLNYINYKFLNINLSVINKNVLYNSGVLQPIFLYDKLLVKNISSSSIFHFMFSYKKNFFSLPNSRFHFYIRKLNFLFTNSTNLGGLSSTSSVYNCYNDRLLHFRPSAYILV